MELLGMNQSNTHARTNYSARKLGYFNPKR